MAAKRMEAAAFDLARTRDQAQPMLAGAVKIAITEGLGTFWFAPLLVEFQRSYPRLVIDLTCAMRSVDVLRMEADVAIQLTKPTAADAKVIKLGKLHSMAYASRSYIDTYGLPTSIEGLVQRRVVLQVAEQTRTQEMFSHFAGSAPQAGFVAIRTNPSGPTIGQLRKGQDWVAPDIRLGHGRSPRANEFRCHVLLRHLADLSSRGEAHPTREAQHRVDHQQLRFTPVPLFRDEFIHPRDLPREYKGEQLVNLFGCFSPFDSA